MPTFALKFLTVDKVLLAVKRAGSGPPIVCLTATGHDAEDFEPLAERLRHKFQIICIEWPGHGDSRADHVPASAARYAALAGSVLQILDVQRPMLIGNSIGGAAAILLAAQRPARAVVLCDSGGLVPVTPGVARVCRLLARFFVAGARGAWYFAPLFALYYRMVLPSPLAAGQRNRIVAHGRERALAISQAWSSFGTPEADIRDIAASLEVPVWIAWARSDRILPLKASLPAIRRIKRTKLDTFDAGHAAFLERPDEFTAGLETFVSGLPPGPLHPLHPLHPIHASNPVRASMTSSAA
jgi:pimeloyl-ACP methyl ester carboxylesterase